MTTRTLYHAMLAAFLGYISAAGAAVRPGSDFAFSQNARLGRGVNILSADPMWKTPGNGRMQERHFALIKQAGYGNVRIPIHPFRFATDQENFTLDPKFLTTLDWAITTALKHDLMPIVDLHEHHEMSRNPLGRKRLFLAVWRQIAVHCRDYPMEVLFELCNEPNMKPEIWNEIQEEARQLIRESNPQRTLIIGTINGNQIQYLPDLKLPDDDRNLIVAVHYYQPIQFTHQGAPWSTKNKDLKDVPWTATAAEQQAVIRDFDTAQKWSRDNDRPLTLGEFGAFEKAAMPHRQLWTNFIARQAEQRKWSWSYWQFDSDFIVYDLDRDRWVTPIQDALIPPPSTR